MKTAELVSPKDRYLKKLLYNKKWKADNVKRKTNKRWGIKTYTAEKRKADGRKYHRTVKGIYTSLKSSCNRKNNSRLNITREEFIKWYILVEKVCHYCGITEVEWQNSKITNRNKRFKRLTLDRIDNSKGYQIGNITLCCYLCNSVKGEFFTEKEMLQIGQIIKIKLKNKII